MSKRIDVKQVKLELDEIISEIRMGREYFIIEQDGESVAAIIPVKMYEVFRSWDENRRELERIIREIHEQNRHFSSEEIERDIQEAIEAVRREEMSRASVPILKE